MYPRQWGSWEVGEALCERYSKGRSWWLGNIPFCGSCLKAYPQKWPQHISIWNFQMSLSTQSWDHNQKKMPVITEYTTQKKTE
jgi:hypothetical protein